MGRCSLGVCGVCSVEVRVVLTEGRGVFSRGGVGTYVVVHWGCVGVCSVGGRGVITRGRDVWGYSLQKIPYTYVHFHFCVI